MLLRWHHLLTLEFLDEILAVFFALLEPHLVPQGEQVAVTVIADRRGGWCGEGDGANEEQGEKEAIGVSTFNRLI